LTELDLFGEPIAPEAGRAEARRSGKSSRVAAATTAEQYRALAERLPARLRMGTSTWSFSGWQGLVYADEYDESTLARQGLSAYAAHPLLRSVGVDRSYYRPLDTDTLSRLRKAVSADFRFLLKAHAALMLPKSARRPVYLEGVPDVFLDADHAIRHVIDPARRVLGETLGVVLFQFSPLGSRVLGYRRELLQRLYEFLRVLPAGVNYAIEWRDPEMLGPDYQQMLHACGAVHGYAQHPRMPPVDAQGDISAALPSSTSGPLVIRWLLAPGRSYEAAKAAYAPFDQLVDPDPVARQKIVGLARHALAAGRDVTIIVNNKAEGSAPQSIVELAREFAASETSLG
jgi:uncharacterized protein YecE (DUF72 family)